MKHFAIIVAAGSGERFAGGVPKALAPIAGVPMLAWSIRRLSELTDGCIVVVPPGKEAAFRTALAEHGAESVKAWVAGGETRQESVRNGLQALPDDATHVLIHDAARVCVNMATARRVLDALATHDAVVPAVPAVDTLIRIHDDKVDAIVDRVHVSGVQTPQGFRVTLIREAHERAGARGFEASDDGTLVLAIEQDVRVVEGDRTNIKVTYPEDVTIAEAILSRTTDGQAI